MVNEPLRMVTRDMDDLEKDKDFDRATLAIQAGTRKSVV